MPTTADVYTADGHKLAEGLTLPGPVVGGGDRLLVLVAEPPNPWTVSVIEWRGRQSCCRFGVLGPVVVMDGRIVGTWKRTIEKDKVVVETDLFILEASRVVAAAAEHHDTFVGLPVDWAA